MTELGVAMWNHLPQMRRRAAETRIEFPTFPENEMSQLIAYLFAKRYFEEEGNPGAGSRVFAAKKCGTVLGAADGLCPLATRAENARGNGEAGGPLAQLHRTRDGRSDRLLESPLKGGVGSRVGPQFWGVHDNETEALSGGDMPAAGDRVPARLRSGFLLELSNFCQTGPKTQGATRPDPL
ncbi:MAG: hypothetical protein HY238_15015 [Acidobacteria bacterium]|nr:hypothetical protein [Acidobacteriota bacterium]